MGASDENGGHRRQGGCAGERKKDKVWMGSEGGRGSDYEREENKIEDSESS